MNVDDVLKFLSGYSACNTFWQLAEGRYAAAAAMLGIAVLAYLGTRK